MRWGEMGRTRNQLRKIRRAHGITQEKLEAASRVKQTTISAIELTGRRPRVDTAIRIARGLTKLSGRRYAVEDVFQVGD